MPVLIAAKVGLVWSRLLDLGDAVLVMVGLEALIVLTGIGEIFLFARRYQHGRASGLDLWASLEEGLNVLVPAKVARLILQELRILAAFFGGPSGEIGSRKTSSPTTNAPCCKPSYRWWSSRLR